VFTDANCLSQCNPDIYAYEYPQCYTDGYIHRYSEHYAYGYSYFNGNSHGNSYSYSYRYRHCHGHCHCHCQANAYRKTQRNAKATSHSVATPLREVAWRFWGAHASRVLVSASTPKRTFRKRHN
jgi:hypothetical protein